jgi:hypothetical protein
MDDDSRFRSIQSRAYEIFLQRDPHSGTAEEDWRKAEAEIEAEGHPRSHHKGPAKLKDQSHWGKLTNHAGEDFENPA